MTVESHRSQPPSELAQHTHFIWEASPTAPRRSGIQPLLLLAVVAVTAGFGCEVEPGPDTPLQQPSRTSFAAEAGPVFASRCADYVCHGDANRPFALYAVARRRLLPADNFTARPLTKAELNANYTATLGFIDAPRGRDTTLVQKALGVGGIGGHQGGAVFKAPSDPECLVLTHWIEGVEP